MDLKSNLLSMIEFEVESEMAISYQKGRKKIEEEKKERGEKRYGGDDPQGRQVSPHVKDPRDDDEGGFSDFRGMMTKRQPRPHDRSIDFPSTPWFIPRFRFIISLLLFVDHVLRTLLHTKWKNDCE